jgi:hypothetical protein
MEFDGFVDNFRAENGADDPPAAGPGRARIHVREIRQAMSEVYKKSS